MCGDIKRGRRLSGPSRGCLRVGANWGHGRVWSTPQTGPICAGNYTPSTIIQRTYVLHSDGRNSKPNNVQPQSACRRQALPTPAPTIEPYTYLAFSPPARADPDLPRSHDRMRRPKANMQDDSIYSVTQQIQRKEASRCAITLLSSWRWPAFWPRQRCLHPDRFWRKALEKCSSRRIPRNCCLPACSIADNRQRRSCATPEASSLTDRKSTRLNSSH